MVRGTPGETVTSNTRDRLDGYGDMLGWMLGWCIQGWFLVSMVGIMVISWYQLYQLWTELQ